MPPMLKTPVVDVLKLIPAAGSLAIENVTMSVLVVDVEFPGKAPVFQFVVVLHAVLVVPVHVASAAFKTSNLPEKMKNNARIRIELAVPPNRVKG